MLHVSFPHNSNTLQVPHLFQIHLQKEIFGALEKPWMPGTVVPFTAGQTQISKLVLHFFLLHFSTLCYSILLLLSYFDAALLMVALVIVTLNH